jgi:peptidyl-prolyl cis-trans isomerase D
MAMMISKFHRLIQNKITWWIVLVIIVFSFVIWGSQARNANSSARRETAVAMLENKPIEQSEFYAAKSAVHLGIVLQNGRDFNITAQIDEALRKQAWQRIASLREAGKLGITASDDEVFAFGQQIPIFHTKEGQFSRQIYDQFCQQILPRFNFSPSGFDQFLREEIILQKAMIMLSRMMFVPPYDAKRYYMTANDSFVVEYAILTPELVEKTVKPGRDEAKKLFDKDPAAYKIPEQAIVRYVAIPISNFLAKAEVKDDDVQKFYNDNIEEYALPSTNTTKGVATNSEFSTEATKYRPLEEVKPKIVTALKERAASELARSNATAFVESLQGSLGASPISFQDAAKKFSLSIETSKPFGEMDDVPGLRVGPEFTHAAFGLSRDEGSNVSEPVGGRDAWYVMAYQDRLPERVPTFEEVIEKVLTDAKSQAIEDSLVALAKKTRDAMDVAAKADQSVAEAAQKAGGVKLVTTEPFSATGSQEQKIENFEYLLRGVLPHNAGEVTDLIPTRGGILVAYVKSRTPADLSAFEQLRPQVVSQIRRAQVRQLFEGWQEFLLRRDNFEDRLKKATGEG